MLSTASACEKDFVVIVPWRISFVPGIRVIARVACSQIQFTNVKLKWFDGTGNDKFHHLNHPS